MRRGENSKDARHAYPYPFQTDDRQGIYRCLVSMDRSVGKHRFCSTCCMHAVTTRTGRWRSWCKQRLKKGKQGKEGLAHHVLRLRAREILVAGVGLVQDVEVAGVGGLRLGAHVVQPAKEAATQEGLSRFMDQGKACMRRGRANRTGTETNGARLATNYCSRVNTTGDIGTVCARKRG